MGLFTRKKKPASLKALSPSPSLVTVVPSPPASPTVDLSAYFVRPQVLLRVALDPVPLKSEDGLFSITVDLDDDLSAIHAAVAERTGAIGHSIFKVSIPLLAHKQAQQYRERYNTPVDLTVSFPAFNVDDGAQLNASLGPAAWSGTPRDTTRLKVKDWFPEGINSAENISVLARPAASGSRPLTFLAHFAPSETTPLSRGGPSKPTLRPPTAVSLCPSRSIGDLKSSLLSARGWDAPAPADLDKVILWRVDMSEEEMIVIGERGGLKGGRMPWPYPPTAPVPIALSDSSLPISHYFSNYHSNARMIAISIWVDPSLTTSTTMPTTPTGTVPPYRFPMDFTEPSSITMSPRRSRQRPSTAPAVVVSTPSAEAAIAHRPLTRLSSTPNPDSMSRPRTASPLSASAVPSRGLGINVPVSALPEHRPSLTPSESSSAEGNVPRLSFSQLSFTSEPAALDNALLTPDSCNQHDDWLSPQYPGLKEKEAQRKNGSVRFASIGSWTRHRVAA